MDRLRRAALTTRLIERMRDNGSWCGETHVQKATFFAQRIGGVSMGYDFILYKHGPFCFDLRDDLAALRADGMVELEVHWPYGPQIVPTSQSEYIRGKFSKTLKKYEGGIAFIAGALGGKGVVDLERLGTALYVSDELEGYASIDEKAERMTKLKPHISRADALAAVHEVSELAENAVRLGIAA